MELILFWAAVAGLTALIVIILLPLALAIAWFLYCIEIEFGCPVIMVLIIVMIMGLTYFTGRSSYDFVKDQQYYPPTQTMFDATADHY